MLDRRSVALARHGQPFGSPYHGVVRDLPGEFSGQVLDLPNGETMHWPLALASAAPFLGAACYELTRPGMPSVPTTPAEAAEGKEWRNRALITAGAYWGNYVAWPAISGNYIYIAPSGNRWRIDIRDLLFLTPGSSEWLGEPTISITADRWGTPGGQVRTRNVQLPSLAALGQDVPLSVDLQAPPGFTVNNSIQLTIIDQNSDGSKLILRLLGTAVIMQDNVIVESRSTPVGYWLWETSADAEDELSYSLTELRTRADTLGARADSETNALNQVSIDSGPVATGTQPGGPINSCDYSQATEQCCIFDGDAVRRTNYGEPVTTYIPFQGNKIEPGSGLWDGQRSVEISNTGVIFAMFFDDAGEPADVRVDVSMTYDMSASFSWQVENVWTDEIIAQGETEGTGSPCGGEWIGNLFFGPGWDDLSSYSESRSLSVTLSITIAGQTYDYVGMQTRSMTAHHEGGPHPLSLVPDTGSSDSDFSDFVGPDPEFGDIEQITMDIADGTLGWSNAVSPLAFETSVSYGINVGYFSNRAFGVFAARGGNAQIRELVRYNEILSPAGSDGQVITELEDPVTGDIPEYHACYNPITHEITRGPSIRSWA